MQKYSSGIVAYNDLYVPMKNAANILLEVKDKDKLYELIVNNDILSLVSERNRKRTGKEILTRLSFLDDKLIYWLAKSDINTSHQINLAAILLKDRSFREFMREVYCSLNKQYISIISAADIGYFFTKKSEHSTTVASWSDGVRRRLGNEYKTILRRSFYGEKQGNDLIITVPFILPEVVQYLCDTDKREIAQLLSGGNLS